MTAKQQIKRMRDYAKLAWASYGYFHLQTKDDNPMFIRMGKSKEQEIKKEISLVDILDLTYKGYKVYKPSNLPTLKPEIIGTLKGDFSPTQAKNFFEKYDLLIHQPNTDSGFSATLFGEKKLQIHNATKEKSYTSQYGYVDYILAIRGTESKKVA